MSSPGRRRVTLRRRLQFRQGAILFVVVCGFGAALYWESRRATMDEVDSELLSACRVLEGTLRALYGRPGQPQPMPPGRRPRPDAPFQPPPFPPPRPPVFDGIEYPPPEARPRIERALNLPRAFEERHEGLDTPPYFAVFRPDGSILKASPTLPRDLSPPNRSTFRGEDVASRRRDRGLGREVLLVGPGRTIILVGRSIEREIGRLNGLLWRLALTGLTVLCVGVVAAWRLADRVCRPVERMSDEAAEISAVNLSRRLDVTDVDAEPARLGEALNAMLDRLEAAFERQVRFTADASHELRTPLAVILAQVELALARPRGVEELRSALETCRRASLRMKTLTEGLLLLARADAGALLHRHERVELRELVEEAVAMFASIAGERGVTLEVVPEAAEVLVDGDPDLLLQVVMNLVGNAVAHNRQGGRVIVSAAVVNDEAVLTVSDTGRGIPEDQLPLVFERFHRADSARSRESGGAGLGLAICRGIVNAHEGAIAISSKEGEGTTAEVRFRRAENDSPFPSARQSA